MGKCYECEDAFPFVKEVIEKLCQQRREAEHGAIVSALMEHPSASTLISVAHGKCPHLSKLRIASNMVQFLSQHYTRNLDDTRAFQERFDRREDDHGDWAYSLR
jgi:hypothetical protein